jgi:hypothetical protein
MVFRYKKLADKLFFGIKERSQIGVWEQGLKEIFGRKREKVGGGGAE